MAGKIRRMKELGWEFGVCGTEGDIFVEARHENGGRATIASVYSRSIGKDDAVDLANALVKIIEDL